MAGAKPQRITGAASGQALTDGDTSAAADEQGGRSLDYSAGDTKTPAGIGTTPQTQGDLSKIIRDGRIEVVVPTGEFAKNVTAVTRIAGTNGGFVLTSSTQNGQAGQFTLRIPAKRFDRAMDQLRALGTVQADAVTGDDVTAEFVDLQARLGILTDRRDLLRDLQSEATSSSEILRFATLIDQVQLEIENIQGQLNFIRDQVAEGTIKVSLREIGAPEAAGTAAHRRRQAQPGHRVQPRVAGIPAGARRGRRWPGLPDPDRRDRPDRVVRGQAGAASRSRSQLSARNRSAAIEAIVASSP